MKLENAISREVFKVEKLRDQSIPFGRLKLGEAQKSLKWTAQVHPDQAILLGSPEVRVIQTPKLDVELMKKCLLGFKIGGETVLEKLPLLSHHAAIVDRKGTGWFHATGDDGKPFGIFIADKMDLEFVVTGPVATQTSQEIEIWMKAEVYGIAKPAPAKS